MPGFATPPLARRLVIRGVSAWTVVDNLGASPNIDSYLPNLLVLLSTHIFVLLDERRQQTSGVESKDHIE